MHDPRFLDLPKALADLLEPNLLDDFPAPFERAWGRAWRVGGAVGRPDVLLPQRLDEGEWWVCHAGRADEAACVGDCAWGREGSVRGKCAGGRGWVQSKYFLPS